MKQFSIALAALATLAFAGAANAEDKPMMDHGKMGGMHHGMMHHDGMMMHHHHHHHHHMMHKMMHDM
jgi:hypothetical protein